MLTLEKIIYIIKLFKKINKSKEVEIMEINITAVNELIKNEFRNNKTWFAEVIGINNSY